MICAYWLTNHGDGSASGSAALNAFKEEQRENASQILAKLVYLEAQIEKKTLSVKKLVEVGTMVKQVKEQLTMAETVYVQQQQAPIQQQMAAEEAEAPEPEK